MWPVYKSCLMAISVFGVSALQKLQRPRQTAFSCWPAVCLPFHAPSAHFMPRKSAAGSICMQVNLKLFTPAPNKRRTVLLFVFRDRTRTPLARLIETWEEDLRQMWASITKPPNYEGCDITDFFEVCMLCSLCICESYDLLFWLLDALK